MNVQMIMSKKKSYSEILEILNHMEKKYIDKVPNKMIDFFERNKDYNHEFRYNQEVSLSEQILEENTLVLLAMLNLNYWCDDESHKKKLMTKYEENEKIYQEKISAEYNSKIASKKDYLEEPRSIEVKDVETANLIEYEGSIFEKIYKKIRKFFTKR